MMADLPDVSDGGQQLKIFLWYLFFIFGNLLSFFIFTFFYFLHIVVENNVCILQ